MLKGVDCIKGQKSRTFKGLKYPQGKKEKKSGEVYVNVTFFTVYILLHKISNFQNVASPYSRGER